MYFLKVNTMSFECFQFVMYSLQGDFGCFQFVMYLVNKGRVSTASRHGRSPPPGRRWVTAPPVSWWGAAGPGCVCVCGVFGLAGSVLRWGPFAFGGCGPWGLCRCWFRGGGVVVWGALWVVAVVGAVRWRPASLPPGLSPRALALLSPGGSPSPCLRAV